MGDVDIPVVLKFLPCLNATLTLQSVLTLYISLFLKVGTLGSSSPFKNFYALKIGF